MTAAALLARPSRLLSTPVYAECVRSLGAAPGDAPFALSYDLFGIRHGDDLGVDVFVQPDISAWIDRDGRLERVRLGPKAPELSRDLAIPAFAFLSWSQLRNSAENLLAEINPQSPGESYAFALTPRGAVLVAEEWHSVRYSHGSGAVAAALCPVGLSAHERVTTARVLSHAVNTLLHAPDRASNLPEIEPLDFAVTVP